MHNSLRSRHTEEGGFSYDGGSAGLGLLFMNEGARWLGFMTGRIKNGEEAREIKEH